MSTIENNKRISIYGGSLSELNFKSKNDGSRTYENEINRKFYVELYSVHSVVDFIKIKFNSLLGEDGNWVPANKGTAIAVSRLLVAAIRHHGTDPVWNSLFPIEKPSTDSDVFVAFQRFAKAENNTVNFEDLKTIVSNVQIKKSYKLYDFSKLKPMTLFLLTLFSHLFDRLRTLLPRMRTSELMEMREVSEEGKLPTSYDAIDGNEPEQDSQVVSISSSLSIEDADEAILSFNQSYDSYTLTSSLVECVSKIEKQLDTLDHNEVDGNEPEQDSQVVSISSSLSIEDADEAILSFNQSYDSYTLTPSLVECVSKIENQLDTLDHDEVDENGLEQDSQAVSISNSQSMEATVGAMPLSNQSSGFSNLMANFFKELEPELQERSRNMAKIACEEDKTNGGNGDLKVAISRLKTLKAKDYEAFNDKVNSGSSSYSKGYKTSFFKLSSAEEAAQALDALDKYLKEKAWQYDLG